MADDNKAQSNYKGRIIEGATILALAGIGALTLALSGPEETYSAKNIDITGDGIKDWVIPTNIPNEIPHFFIGQKDGSFLKAELVICDGIGFYKVNGGTYDTDGHFFQGKKK